MRALKLIDALFEQPVVTVRRVEQIGGCANDTASGLVRQFVADGVDVAGRSSFRCANSDLRHFALVIWRRLHDQQGAP